MGALVQHRPADAPAGPQAPCILEIGLGFWASQQLVPARAALLIIWVGVFAIFRGITEIVTAFELKSLQHR